MKHGVPLVAAVERESLHPPGQRQQPRTEAAGVQLHESPRQLQQQRLISAAFGETEQRMRAGGESQAENLTGMPDKLKGGIESLSGMDMSAVRVHRSSDRPAQLNALAYAQGDNIYLGPGQEQHLPHEAWHVVQQRQGRVQVTTQLQGFGINDDAGLEREADEMGMRAVAQPKMVPLAAASLWSLPGVGNACVIHQRQAAIQLEPGACESLGALCVRLKDLIVSAHNNKSIPLILGVLNLMTTAIRYAREDTSVGAQFGSGLLAVAIAIDAAATAVQQWQAADGQGKEQWKKRADALEKLVMVLITAATVVVIPINPTVAGFVGAVGAGGIQVLRSVYDIAADYWWPSEETQSLLV